MATAIHHAISSARKWGGKPTDYTHLHDWFDQTKSSYCDPRHRALRHHAEGISWLIEKFGDSLVNSDGKLVPTRWVGEQHVREDCGRIPSAKDWLQHMTIEPWMGRHAERLSDTLEPEATAYATTLARQSPLRSLDTEGGVRHE